MNLEAMNHLGAFFRILRFPVLLGTSRKSMIGLALDLPVDQRVEGTFGYQCNWRHEGMLFCPCPRY